jgi:hypothetical protein
VSTIASLAVAVLVVTAIAAVAAVLYLAYRSDARQIEGRTRRHREVGGRPGDEPDRSPGHAGGSGGAT